MSLKHKTLHGVAWSALERVLGQSLQFAITVILIRLLTPEDFGLMAMLMVFIGFAAIVSEFGFGAALVQKQDISPQQISGVFWINLIFGVLAATLFFLAAPALAGFYGILHLEVLSRVLAFVFVLSAPGIVPRALLTKVLAFKELAKIEISAIAISGVCAILLALSEWGVWALVVQALLREGIRTAAGFLFVDWRPRTFSIAAVKELAKYSTNLSGFQFINYWARNSDNLLIGKFLSVASLGIYTRAYSILLLPMTQIIGVFTQVMFPTLSTIQDDKPRVRSIYLRAMQIISFVVYPTMLGLLVVARPFALTLFGIRWIEVIPLIQIFCVLSLIQALCNPVGWIYMSQGRTDWMFRWGMFGSASLIIAIIIGVSLGSIQSVAWSYLTANVLLMYPCIAIPGKLIQMTFTDVARAVAPSLVCASIMAILVWCVGTILPEEWPASVHLLVQMLSGTALYLMLAARFRIRAYVEILHLIPEYIGISATGLVPTVRSLGEPYRRTTQR